MADALAHLILTNPLTQDQFEYDLIGHGEEPLAVDHIILNCIARKASTKVIEIKNPYFDKEVTYKVETDLINP